MGCSKATASRYFQKVAMYVCVCHAVTDRDIRKAVDRGARSLFDVQNELPVGSCCGSCEDTAESVVHEHMAARGLSTPTGCGRDPASCCRDTGSHPALRVSAETAV